MAARAAVWRINREVLELMLRRWHQQTRCEDSAQDLRVVNFGLDGGQLVVLVELVGADNDPSVLDPAVRAAIDKILREA